MQNLRIRNPPHLPLSSPKSRSILCAAASSGEAEQQPPSKAAPSSSSEKKKKFPSISAIPDWADAIQELGMRKKRPLYTPSDWRFHRSSRRHLRHLLTSLSSRVVLSLAPPVLSLTAAAAALALYNSAVSAGGLLPPCLPLLRASPLPYQLTAPALALLLVFRTEASYSRLQEGRRCWMRVIAGAAEMAALLMGPKNTTSNQEGLRKAVMGYIMAFPVALKCHVLSDSNIRTDLQNLLEEDDIEVVASSKHRPRCIIEFISQSLQMLQLEEAKRHLLESKLCCFHEGIGVCEQLLGIPIPLSYTRLTSRFLVLWHLTLPVILWDDCNWIVVPATFISAASLFCIEEVGVLIEEPFPMLSLDELCEQLHNNIREAMLIEESVRLQIAAKMKGQADEHAVNGWPNS
ncbi:putative UPF0187 protein, chloroplastic [Iris pallida]|uniref:UPF0187 protein, chloroplastic n=1 Tax=Iris pallida TaxID=29817 RepID=A0AAX6HJK2_IRIPA|nr:putative UPF0187 protein, chloroplastic [Iris pallida]